MPAMYENVSYIYTFIINQIGNNLYGRLKKIYEQLYAKRLFIEFYANISRKIIFR